MPKPFYIELKMFTLLGKEDISPFDLKPLIKNMTMKEITKEIITYEFDKFNQILSRPVKRGN